MDPTYIIVYKFKDSTFSELQETIINPSTLGDETMSLSTYSELGYPFPDSYKPNIDLNKAIELFLTYVENKGYLQLTKEDLKPINGISLDDFNDGDDKETGENRSVFLPTKPPILNMEIHLYSYKKDNYGFRYEFIGLDDSEICVDADVGIIYENNLKSKT
jgi:hypothetical protein